MAVHSEEELKIEGLWSYESLGVGQEPEAPLTGLFLFQNGHFIQQSIHDGDPFDEQFAMGHSGTYEKKKGELVLLAKVGLVLDPTKSPVLESRRNSTHHIAVQLSGGDLTLDFLEHDVTQRLSRLGQSELAGKVVPLEEGTIGFMGDRFVLVAEHPGKEAAAGSGRFSQSGDQLELRVDRWFTLQGDAAHYQRDTVLEVTFDGKQLTLPGGMVFQVRN